jgi:phosphoribosylanthranilate isomerase
MSLRIKICGITSHADAFAAAEAGAHALGFMFYERSPRAISPAAAAEIIRQLPPFVAKVGVFVDAPQEFIRQTISQCGLDTLQFHGGESSAFCSQFDLRTIKAFRVRGEETLRELPAYETSAWLLDSFVPDQFGGTGAKFNWELASAAKKLGRPIILAGGLTPENVGEAVRQVQPYGVDVSSGVEAKPGRKDHGKIRAFVEAALLASSKSK